MNKNYHPAGSVKFPNGGGITGRKSIQMICTTIVILAASFTIPATIVAIKGGKIKFGNLIDLEIPERKETSESDPSETD